MDVEAGSASDNPVWQSRRLWSLWDMLKLKSDPFIRAVGALHSMGGMCLVFKSKGELIGGVLPEHRRDLEKPALALQDALQDLEAPLTRKSNERLLNGLRKDTLTLPELEMLLLQVMPRLCDEFGEQTFLALSSREATLYGVAEPPFGSEVAEKFKSAIYDINEAAKCLALGRSTASVFHLMRVVERGLRAVYLCMGLTVPDNNSWGIWLKGIRDERMRRGDRKWSENDYFQDVYSRLDATKDAQRDPTIHIETIHTESEAAVIYENTKALMQKIASRMDEDGKPKA